MPTRAERISTFEQAPKEVRELYESPVADALFDEMVEKYQIPDEKLESYLHTTGDVVLGFNKLAELPSRLQKEVGLSQEDAKALTADLTKAWEPIVKREEEEVQAKKNEVANLANKIEAIKPATPAETVEKHESVKPIHMMEADTKRIQGYGVGVGANEADTAINGEPIIKSISQIDLQTHSTSDTGKPADKDNNTV